MAINPNTEYSGRVTAPSTEYPYGSSKNETSPGAGDGTPYELARANDIFGFQQALLKAAGIVPSGNADEVGASEYLQALIEEAMGRASYLVEDTGSVANAYELKAATDNDKPRSYFDNMRAVFRVAAANTGAATINVAGLGVRDIKDSSGTALVAGVIVTTAANTVIYDAVNGWFVLDVFVAVALPLLHIQDQKSSGTDGGPASSGAYATRDLTQVLTNEISGSSLSANQIILPAGTYEVNIKVPGHQVATHKAQLYNVTDASVALLGTVARTASSESRQSSSVITGRFTLAATKTLAVQHRVSAGKLTDGFGLAAGFGDLEIYTDVQIRKVG